MAITSSNGFTRRGLLSAFAATALVAAPAYTAAAGYLKGAGDIRRLLMNVPPGSMKSLLTSVIWPAWEWGPRAMQEMRADDQATGDQHQEADHHREMLEEFQVVVTHFPPLAARPQGRAWLRKRGPTVRARRVPGETGRRNAAGKGTL